MKQIVADITNEDDARRVIKETVTKFGQIDVLVNNAGDGTIATLDSPNYMEVVDKIFAINCRAGKKTSDVLARNSM